MVLGGTFANSLGLRRHGTQSLASPRRPWRLRPPTLGGAGTEPCLSEDVSDPNEKAHSLGGGDWIPTVGYMSVSLAFSDEIEAEKPSRHGLRFHFSGLPVRSLA